MNGSDAPGIAMMVIVAAGLGTALLDPDTVARVVTVADGPVPPAVTVVVWAVALCGIVVGTPLWWWGPVRVARATMTWRLSGPADRADVLNRRRNRAVAGAGCACLTTALIVSPLDPAAVPVLAFVGVATTIVVVVATSAHQQMRSSAEWTARSSSRPRGMWSTRELHREVAAPDDGLVGAVRLATVTMDLDSDLPRPAGPVATRQSRSGEPPVAHGVIVDRRRRGTAVAPSG